jgi:hypothetical protein
MLTEKAGAGIMIKLNLKNLPPGEHAAHNPPGSQVRTT